MPATRPFRRDCVDQEDRLSNAGRVVVNRNWSPSCFSCRRPATSSSRKRPSWIPENRPLPLVFLTVSACQPAVGPDIPPDAHAVVAQFGIANSAERAFVQEHCQREIAIDDTDRIAPLDTHLVYLSTKDCKPGIDGEVCRAFFLDIKAQTCSAAGYLSDWAFQSQSARMDMANLSEDEQKKSRILKEDIDFFVWISSDDRGLVLILELPTDIEVLKGA